MTNKNSDLAHTYESQTRDQPIAKPEEGARDEVTSPQAIRKDNYAFAVGQVLCGEFDIEQAQQALEALNGSRKDD